MQHIPGERYIEIGLQGEHDAREVQFDISGLIDRWPQAVWRLMYRRPGDTAPYPGETTSEEAVLTWHIQRRDVQTAGSGQYQLIGTQIGADGAEMLVAKSPIGTVLIHDSLGCEVPPPDAIVTWLEQIDKAAQAADASASAAEASATQAQSSAATAKTLAQQASNSAQLAAQSAYDAAYSALTAKEYAQTAGNSATIAEQSETRAQLSATAAQQYASQAQGSASAAAQSAASAQGDAGKALQSANSASTAASNASASANAASNSAQQAASAADTARTDAATAQDAAQDAVEHASAAQKAAEAAENAAQEALGIIDDGVVARDSTWSSNNIVATLCPPFEVTGDIVQCEPVEGSALDMTVEIVPTQEGEGDPSPENVRPVVGWDSVNIWRSGKNLLNEQNLTNGVYKLDFTISSESDVILRFRSIKIYLPQGNYILSGNVPLNIARSFTNYDNSQYITTGSNTSVGVTAYQITMQLSGFLYLSVRRYDNGAYEGVNLKLEPGSTATAYEPYRGETIAVALGQTVYGGTLDADTGTLTVTWKEADLSDPKFYPTGGNGIRFNNALDSDYADGEGLCSHGKIGKNITVSGNVAIGTQPGVSSVYFSGILDILGLASVEEYIEWAKTNEIKIVYKTKNPFTVQLSPCQVAAISGTNTLYADAGPVTVKGYSDPRAMITKLSDRIAALEDAQTTI